MNHHPAITNITIENSLLQGTIFSPSLHQSFAIEIDPETDTTTTADFDDLIKELQRLIEYLTPDQLQKITTSIAREITTSAYEQSDYTPTEPDFTALENDLKLMKIITFPEGFAFDYAAEANYPGNQVTVQLDEDFNIEDVAIYE
jgi:hypothetical protein